MGNHRGEAKGYAEQAVMRRLIRLCMLASVLLSAMVFIRFPHVPVYEPFGGVLWHVLAIACIWFSSLESPADTLNLRFPSREPSIGHEISPILGGLMFIAGVIVGTFGFLVVFLNPPNLRSGAPYMYVSIAMGLGLLIGGIRLIKNTWDAVNSGEVIVFGEPSPKGRVLLTTGAFLMAFSSLLSSGYWLQLVWLLLAILFLTVGLIKRWRGSGDMQGSYKFIGIGIAMICMSGVAYILSHARFEAWIKGVFLVLKMFGLLAILLWIASLWSDSSSKEDSAD